jgi:hypothetical protein
MFALACFGLRLPEAGLLVSAVTQLPLHCSGSWVADAWGGGWGSYSGTSQQCGSAPLALCMLAATARPMIGFCVVAGSAPAARPKPQETVSCCGALQCAPWARCAAVGAGHRLDSTEGTDRQVMWPCQPIVSSGLLAMFTAGLGCCNVLAVGTYRSRRAGVGRQTCATCGREVGCRARGGHFSEVPAPGARLPASRSYYWLSPTGEQHCTESCPRGSEAGFGRCAVSLGAPWQHCRAPADGCVEPTQLGWRGKQLYGLG